MNLVYTAVIPTDYEDSEIKVRDLIKVLWTFKVIMLYIVHTLMIYDLILLIVECEFDFGEYQ